LAVVSLNQERKPMWKRRLLLLTPFLAALFLFTFSVTGTFAQGATTSSAASNFDTVGAGLAVGLAGIGAGLAIYGSTSSGLAAMVERPELTTWVLVFAGLGEGIAIYGLVVAILILGRH
jgi:V/A-type H+/Na+-transporting ATPase subunit K